MATHESTWLYRHAMRAFRFLPSPPVTRDAIPPSAFSWERIVASAHAALHYVATHTGVPVVLVAAVALVLSWNFLKSGARFVMQVGVVVALLLIATEFGWISW